MGVDAMYWRLSRVVESVGNEETSLDFEWLIHCCDVRKIDPDPGMCRLANILPMANGYVRVDTRKGFLNTKMHPRVTALFI